MAGRAEIDDILDAALDDLVQEENDHGRGGAVRSAAVRSSLEGPVREDEDKQSAGWGQRGERNGGGEGTSDHNPLSLSEEEERLISNLEGMMEQLYMVGDDLGSNRGKGVKNNGAEGALDDLIRQMSGQLEEMQRSSNRTETNQKGVSGSHTCKKKGPDKSPRRKMTEESTLDVPPSTTGSGIASAPESGTSGGDVDRAVSRLLSDMAKASAGQFSSSDEMPDIPEIDNLESAAVEEMGEEMMKSMMEEFEKFGQKNDTDEVLDGMMKQLLSKELMYDPMKQVCERFPRWLAENKSTLSDAEYQRYGHQYQYFQRIVHVYETDPDNFPRLMELMQDIQEYGQPPADIVKELAPGLEFDEEGMPKMDAAAMGGMFPPGMPMPPFPGSAGDENCIIM